MKKMSIKASILIPTIAVLVAGITFMSVIISYVSSSTTNDLSDRLVSARVNEYANKFQSMCADSYGAAIALAPILYEVGESSENPREEVITILTSVLQANKQLVSVWTVWEPNAFDGKDKEHAGTPNHDATGRFIPFVLNEGGSYSVGYVPDYDTGDFYLGARNRGKPYITDPYECDFGGKRIPIYTITVPIMRNGVFVGAVGIDINPSEIIETMNEGSILDEGYLYVLSPGGTISSHRNSDLILKGYESTWLKNYQSEIDSILTKGGSLTGKAYSDQAKENVRFLVSGVMIGDTGRYWAVCGIVPERLVTASSNRLILDVVLIGVVLIIVIALTVLFIVRIRLKRLPDITSAAEAIANGETNLSLPPSETEPTNNEITLLSRAFTSMANAIKAQADAMTQIADGDYTVTVSVRSDEDIMNRGINNMIDHTTDVMRKIRASSKQVSSASQQIANGAQTLAQGSTEQASAVEELSVSISEIAEKTIKNAETAREAVDLSDIIRSSAEKGSSQMNHMMKAVNDINEASGRIGKVIKVIDDIAFQTNILALNAAVEAARAGQHGKGFAVVAEEVRNLAAKSSEAAKETSGLIENSVEKANLGLKIATETSSSLVEIVGGINRSAGIVAQIARLSNEQAVAIKQINMGIDQVTQVVQQNSATAQESAAASEEMSGQSDMLAQLISQFKVEDRDSNLMLPSGSGVRKISSH